MSGARTLLVRLGCVAVSAALSFWAAWLLRGSEHWYSRAGYVLALALYGISCCAAVGCIMAWAIEENR